MFVWAHKQKCTWLEQGKGQYWGSTQAFWDRGMTVESKLSCKPTLNVSVKRKWKQNRRPLQKFPLAGNKRCSQISCQHVMMWESQVSSKDPHPGFGSQVRHITRKLCDTMTTSWKESTRHAIICTAAENEIFKFGKAFSTSEISCMFYDLIPASILPGNSLPLYE